jgi:hypothetical protein
VQTAVVDRISGISTLSQYGYNIAKDGYRIDSQPPPIRCGRRQFNRPGPAYQVTLHCSRRTALVIAAELDFNELTPEWDEMRVPTLVWLHTLAVCLEQRSAKGVCTTPKCNPFSNE